MNTVEAGPAPGSLADRLRTRREALEKNATRVWDLPGYDGILAVEFRAVGYATIRKIVSRNADEEDEALLELYVACDTLMSATEEVFEVSPDDGKLTATGERWIQLAERADLQLPDNPTQRQALLALVPDTALMALYRRYERFVGRARGEAEEAVVRDFERTA